MICTTIEVNISNTMTLPKFTEFKLLYTNFIKTERITWKIIYNPCMAPEILLRHRFIHFFVTGGISTLIDLTVTWALTTFIFGLDRYFTAFLFGITINSLSISSYIQ